ncbi:photosystem II protein PsbQ [Aetokthonos hydrillicola Thurmond2011]|jgi:photosystem II protein PsbQ|uniref:Photosystem II protein PsbQ n=1 Tax=Aetokthonos hydrillicola Thurmond2011 TaxID=2712845 RepID=A0AAP5M757_9CYAN|nr:photosystem II protein PsbQ [Aetokthonos hydrillicola]MBO3462686.1 photosystem II protein PsbQ [Aetokthonos hydrillicola CCALA 1050]MBW4588057.1 photosystem II protein PsbQ [Aetokthonos hydrillicola CCALA 1050]MDR9893372.1 photosystem II protein PsbQ [Aetokthonos hydrillicola Thurmond2011]
MKRQRSLLSLILVIVATFLISCGSPTVATAPPTYTPAQLEKIQEYVPDIQSVRDRAQELQKLIENKQWVKVGNFIHGPMAEARLNMTYIAANLLPQDQKIARQLGRSLFDHLVKIDQAATTGNSLGALNNYQGAYTDIDKFLQLLPKTNS